MVSFSLRAQKNIKICDSLKIEQAKIQCQAVIFLSNLAPKQIEELRSCNNKKCREEKMQTILSQFDTNNNKIEKLEQKVLQYICDDDIKLMSDLINLVKDSGYTHFPPNEPDKPIKTQ